MFYENNISSPRRRSRKNDRARRYTGLCYGTRKIFECYTPSRVGAVISFYFIFFFRFRSYCSLCSSSRLAHRRRPAAAAAVERCQNYRVPDVGAPRIRISFASRVRCQGGAAGRPPAVGVRSRSRARKRDRAYVFSTSARVRYPRDPVRFL